MSIIGIIASERQTNQIKREIEKQNIKLEIVCINNKSIENVKNIKFEILVIQNSLDKVDEKKEYVRAIIKNSKYILLNTDKTVNDDIFKDMNVKILTYGLKQKTTITASSIEEDKVIISIQRGFKNIKGKIIDQQEIPVQLTKNSTINLYNSLIKIGIINILND